MREKYKMEKKPYVLRNFLVKVMTTETKMRKITSSSMLSLG